MFLINLHFQRLIFLTFEVPTIYSLPRPRNSLIAEFAPETHLRFLPTFASVLPQLVAADVTRLERLYAFSLLQDVDSRGVEVGGELVDDIAQFTRLAAGTDHSASVSSTCWILL
jgi:hypothetical protein